jgi:hypothetical protein
VLAGGLVFVGVQLAWRSRELGWVAASFGMGRRFSDEAFE